MTQIRIDACINAPNQASPTLAQVPNYNEPFSLQLLEDNLGGPDRVLLVEGFRLDSPSHHHYVQSLLSGRLLYNTEKDAFVQLTKLTLCIETSSSTGKWN